MYVVFVFCCISLGCVSAQPTINQCTSDETIRQVALMEQTLAALQSMDRRLQSMERRLEESNNGLRCRRNGDGERTCYKLIRALLTWSDARAYCQSDGDADLVSIESMQEQMFLLDMTEELKHQCEIYHTSGRKDSNGQWIWRATEQPFTYTSWVSGQPDNSMGSEDSCSLWNRKGDQKLFWNDVRHLSKFCFICEYH